MKIKYTAAAVLLAAGSVSFSAQAAAPAALAANGCMGCHSVEAKVVGPAFKEVAAKYKGQADAAKSLSASIKAGGAGKWGPIPMPPQAQLKDDDLKSIVDWLVGGAS